MNNKRPCAIFCGLLALLTVATGAGAATEGPLQHANVNVRDTAAIQRGAKLFVNYCFSCHSASYMRYNRLAEDLGLGEELVMRSLVFADAKIGDTMDIAMRPADAEEWLGKAPPDLSLIARSRGADWLYTYFLTFYRDETGGWNNLMLPNASMPHVLWQMQGIQEPVYADHDGRQVIEHLQLAKPGLQSPEEYAASMRDLVTFFEYLSEPAEIKRRNVGIWVMLFLALFALVAYALKAEYWRDVH
ncbi:MAG: cytochrome c1 [Lysobacterales bacterium]|nr:MAG: cytochrome c1 [Xanthomonadales bacterium]